MRSSYQVAVLVAGLVLISTVASAGGFEDRPTGERVGYTAYAAAANVVPIVSATVAPRCLPGYFVCKLSFAAVGLITAGEQLLMSGGSDLAQTRALLHRGFGGDWMLTGAHAAGDVVPDPLPDPLPVASPAPDAEPGSAESAPAAE